MYTIDMHCDTISKMLYQQGTGKEYGSLRENRGHLDLLRLKRAQSLVQNFALFVELKSVEDPFENFLQLEALFQNEMNHNKELVTQVTSYADIERAEKSGKIGALLTVEEGAVCKGEIKKLETLYQKGVRMLTLTWNYPNELGFPNVKIPEGNSQKRPDFKTPNTEDGLTEKGIEFVEAMEEMGMIVDVSHLSDAGFYDVLRVSKKPFTASHSNARSICNCIRNLTDDMIHKLADRGGVTGLNFCADFLTEEVDGKENPGTMDAVLAHARHIIQVGGLECVGLGTDFDGIATNKGIPDVSYLPKLEEEFEKAGFTHTEIEHIFYKNVLRLYKETIG
ncbi:MAG: dipeptidase [Lachnospiraceae bacterium]